jgi:hypothetical protein
VSTHWLALFSKMCSGPHQYPRQEGYLASWDAGNGKASRAGG